ncbi:helix-turn-helix domain-containing protein [Novipirellula artificiosorum]|uniref:MarR family protein n=1 Tax=Novipirellula artificiosorum TaxID=2528016 RepID=A0A5C6D9C6_9BACT|nr:helix-turn-helix domain-containing protein [Novipirellula artificiosorum]TWU33743.1 MarR family protein [Novipirellula artificiosorum]
MTRTTTKPKRKTADRFAVLNAFVDFTLRGLTRPDVAVWLVLYRDTRDGIAKTSQADIGKRCGMSDRNVRRIIKRLESLGLLIVVQVGGIQKGPSSYRVLPMSKQQFDKL